MPCGVRTIALEGAQGIAFCQSSSLKKSEKGSSGSGFDSCHFPKLLPFSLCILPVSLKGINIIISFGLSYSGKVDVSPSEPAAEGSDTAK